jgi:outer membrane protein OmpA-like peptidoglycan-associated protein
MVHTMITKMKSSIPFPSQIGLLLLASAFAIPALAQQAQPVGSSSATSPATAQTQPSTAPLLIAPKEGFWGRVNPFARKKWVNDRVNPLKDRLSELDEVNAKNAHDIQDVDARAQAGIHHAQSSADAANQLATTANDQAQKAGNLAQGASGHVDKLNSTVGGLDQYKQIDEVEVTFRGGQPILSAAARKQLDTMAASLTGRQGYILEIEAHAPGAGSAGIQNSGRLAEAVKRYLVTEHQIPVYRLHSVALGNIASSTDSQEAGRHIKTASVHIRLMENSLAAG